MASLFCLFKFRSHRPNQGLALVNPAFAEKVSFHLVHKACAINQVNAGEPVPHERDGAECLPEFLTADAYHFRLVWSAGSVKTNGATTTAVFPGNRLSNIAGIFFIAPTPNSSALVSLTLFRIFSISFITSENASDFHSATVSVSQANHCQCKSRKNDLQHIDYHCIIVTKSQYEPLWSTNQN